MTDNNRHDKERDNLVDLQMTVTEIMLAKAKGEEVDVTAQELNAMTKHLSNNNINVQALIDKDVEESKGNEIEVELPEEMKTGFRKVGG